MAPHFLNAGFFLVYWNTSLPPAERAHGLGSKLPSAHPTCESHAITSIVKYLRTKVYCSIPSSAQLWLPG